jgi:hypothetical protein
MEGCFDTGLTGGRASSSGHLSTASRARGASHVPRSPLSARRRPGPAAAAAQPAARAARLHGERRPVRPRPRPSRSLPPGRQPRRSRPRRCAPPCIPATPASALPTRCAAPCSLAVGCSTPGRSPCPTRAPRSFSGAADAAEHVLADAGRAVGRGPRGGCGGGGAGGSGTATPLIAVCVCLVFCCVILVGVFSAGGSGAAGLCVSLGCP